MDTTPYWGCALCGHETDEGYPCWECETGKYMGWLDQHGNPTEAPQTPQHPQDGPTTPNQD